MAARPSPLLDLAERRRELASLFSWAIPTERGARAACRSYAPLVECGAGMGYWLALLRARGVDAIGYDLKPPGRRKTPITAAPGGRGPQIQRQSSVKAARRHRERSLVLCWPPYDDDAASYEALRAYRGDVVIHIGERDEGATGSVRFHRELALNWTLAEELELPHWPRLQDRLMVYRRNAQRRPHRRARPLLRVPEVHPYRRHRPLRRVLQASAAGARAAGRTGIASNTRATVVEAMPPALRKAFEASPARVR